MRILPLTLPIVVASLAASAAAATLVVDPGGEGDFLTIQAALDAAQPGDTVQLAAGAYRDYATVDVGGTATDVYALVETDDLTIVGAGAGQSVIGPEDPGIHGPGTVIAILGRNIQTLTIEQLAVRDVVGRAVVADGCALAAASCTFAACGYGIYGEFPAGGDVAACFLQDCQIGVQATGLSSGVTVRSTTFDGCGAAVRLIGAGVTGVTVRDCTLLRGEHGAMLLQGAEGQLLRCRLEDQVQRGVYVAGTSAIQLESCTFSEPQAVGIGLIGTDARLRGVNTVVESGVTCLHVGGSADVVFGQNHLLRTADDAWFVRTDETVAGPARTADLGNVWWGTTDPATIAAWILDAADDPQAIALTVDVTPIAGGQVSTEAASWSDLKARFRQGAP